MYNIYMKFLKKVKTFLGLEKYSPYVSSYYERSNVKSAIYLSSVVISLELWMIISTIFNQFFGESKRSSLWLWHHVPCYICLLCAGVLMLVYSLLYYANKRPNRIAGKVINIVFSIVSILFGIYISWLDYIKGEQFITLITMTLFVFCFLQWRPIYTLLFLTSSFVFFYFICNKVNPATYATTVNLIIIWIAIVMASINSFHQKIKEAKKDERLEQANNILLRLSISDEITGISNMSYFISQTLSKINDKGFNISDSLFLFLDVEHFKNYNEKYGFVAGNEFLKNIGQLIEKEFQGDYVAHFSNDNYVVFTKDVDIQKKLQSIRNEIIRYDEGIKMDLKTGAYRLKNRDCLPIVACDHARYACNSIKKKYEQNYCEYTDQMDQDFYRKQYIINNIDKAIENEYIKVFYQPVISSKDGKLVGLEALARWDDPEYGFLMPGLFIETLEEYHQIHKLDMYVLNRVCKDIKANIDSNLDCVPVSLNFSRSDFDILDLSEEVQKSLEFYGISKDLIHVEITESALTENDGNLQHSLSKFRESGYKLWLDDFGSGYSGLNVLKEYEFDVMKIDMKFLQHFGENEKAKIILKNIVSLAKDIGMGTLTEGVETEEAFNFLKEIGCERLQGYLFGKPMPRETLLEKINQGTYVMAKTNA